jgi:hypothetical protein
MPDAGCRLPESGRPSFEHQNKRVAKRGENGYKDIMLAPTSLVLVCLLPSPRDLEIARLLGWYRIPLRSAPKVIAVDALAFYQPASFGDSGGRIEWIAPVYGHELTTRRELLRDEPDHPRAGEEYFKVQIGTLERLPHPVLAGRWKRITFLYTTGEYLLQAARLNDLAVRAEERALLWRSLRERAQNNQVYRTDLPGGDLPPEVLAGLLGIKAASSSKKPAAGGLDDV